MKKIKQNANDNQLHKKTNSRPSKTKYNKT